MSFRYTDVDIKEFLVGINLGQYFLNFQGSGFNTLQDCMEINNHMLQQIGISPTGHRRRILKHLEAIFSKMQEKPASVEIQNTEDFQKLENSYSQQCCSNFSAHVLTPSVDRRASRIFDEQTRKVCGNNCVCEENHELADCESREIEGSVSSDLDTCNPSCQKINGSTDATAIIEDTPENELSEKTTCVDSPLARGLSAVFSLHSDDAQKEMSLSFAVPSPERKPSEDDHMVFEGLEDFSDDPPDSPFFEFKDEMVENYLYSPYPQNCVKTAPKKTRSFLLRHRPVPEIPGSSKSAVSPSFLQGRRHLNNFSISFSRRPISQRSDSADEKPPLISPYVETFLFNGLEDTEVWGSGNELSSTQESNRNERSHEGDSLPTQTCNNQKWEMSADIANSKLVQQEDKPTLSSKFTFESEYSTVNESSQYVRRRKYKTTKSYRRFRSGNVKRTTMDQKYCAQWGPIEELVNERVTSPKDSIAPYACFYGQLGTRVKEGWLDKLSPHGKHVFQKRWVKFDGESISYYNNDKEVYSKGIILLSAMSTVRVHGDNKFEVVTAHRIFVFRAEKEDERNNWITVILSALQSQPETSRVQTLFPPEKSGYLEMKGYKAKIFTLLQGNNVWICKNDQDFKTGYGITVIPMNVANVRQVDRPVKQSFVIITPYRNFSFTAESEKEKQEWIEALQQSIAETLSDYEVAEKIWFNESNKTCADCRSPDPDWASINLCVVICKKCAGQHRSLGPRDSKVRSLKMDASIWSNELIEIFVMIGNKRANSFWEGNLQPGEELSMDAPTDRRLTFITQKYKQGRFRKTVLLYKSQEELNKALCAAVVKHDVLETMMLLFSGADVMCATGDPRYSTPYLLAKKAGQRLQMEFLYHNKFSDFSNYRVNSEHVSCQDSSSSTFICEYLYKIPMNAAKEKKLKEECNRRWCALESGFLSYYESDKTASPNGMIDIGEVICLAASKADSFSHSGALFTFEIYLLSERFFLFGSETTLSQRQWIQAIAKHFVPIEGQSLLERNYEVIGQLYYKDYHNIDSWKKGWFALEKTNLHFCVDLGSCQENTIHLRRLQELTISSITQNGEKIDVLLLVEKGRTFYIHGHTKLDFTVWHSAIEKAAGTDGNVLEDQQLSENDVPIIVNSCMAFVMQYGLGSKYIYQKGGDPSNVTRLLESFKKDARSVKLRADTNRLEDVTDALKCFLSEIDDALLTKELYPFWISALDTLDEKERVRKYSAFIRTLPPVNRATLAALIEHLYRVQKCSEINHMNPHNLAMVFSACLFQTQGQTSEEVDVIEDLIVNYVHLFDVHENQVKQMDIENSFITKWKDTQVSQAGDLLIEVYVERKEPDCSVIIRISPVTEAEELTNDILGLKTITPHKDDMWAIFEVIENGELERPLHYTENVLEQILHWSSLPNPGSACLIMKRFPAADTMKLYNERNTEVSVRAGYLKYKEEPSKLLSGNKFQERYFVLREGNLLLYRDMKSSKPEKVRPVKLLKLYLGVKKKMKPPTKHLCCDGRDSQLEWMSNIFMMQHSNIRPPDGKAKKQSITKNPKIGGLALIPIQHERSPPKAKVNTSVVTCGLNLNAKLEYESDSTEDRKSLKQRVSMLTQRLEHKEEKARSHCKKHRSLICLEDTGEEDLVDFHQEHYKESKSPKKSENKTSQTHVESDKQLPANVMQELSAVLEKHRALHEKT